MKHMEACISARKDRESSVHHCGGSVKLVQACLTARRHRESTYVEPSRPPNEAIEPSRPPNEKCLVD